MVDAIQLSSEFLKRINIQPVKELEGEAIGLNQGSTIAGRTNTKGGTPRKPVDPTGLESNTYKCEKLILMSLCVMKKWMHGHVSQISMLNGKLL